jgi:hypothetical protein
LHVPEAVSDVMVARLHVVDATAPVEKALRAMQQSALTAATADAGIAR